MDWLRWIAVLPAALLGMILSAFPLHFILYQTLSGWIEPYPETPERVLLPLVAAAVFVWVGARVAPHHKTETAVALFGLWLLFLGVAVGILLTGGNFGGMQFTAQGGGLAPMMALIGAALGLYIVRKQSQSDAASVHRAV